MTRLETERLLFRDHEPGDLIAYCEIESDPEYRRPQVVPPRAELERSFREAVLPKKAMDLLATVYKPDGCYIGRCGLYPNRGEDGEIFPGEAQVAYYLARPYWGRGLATEAVRAFVENGFNELGLRKIEAGMNTRNAASVRVAEKAGFRRIKTGEGGGNTWYLYELRNPSSES